LGGTYLLGITGEFTLKKRIDVLDAMEKARPCRSSENVPGLPQVAKDAMLLEFLGYAFHNAMKILVLERAS
jgi:hypothetical protein